MNIINISLLNSLEKTNDNCLIYFFRLEALKDAGGDGTFDLGLQLHIKN